MSRPRTPLTLLARLLPLVLPLCLGVICSCSTNEEPAPRRVRPQPPVSVEFSRLDRGTQPARQVGRLRVPEGLAPWTAEAPRTRTGPLPGADPAGAPFGVLLSGDSTKLLRIPGVFQPEAFNRVVVELASRVELNAELEFHAEDRPSGECTARLEAGTAELRELRFEAGGLPLLRKAGDELRLKLRSAEPCFVAGVSFWKVPFDEFLADPSTGPVPITIGGDTRPALGVSNTLGLQLGFRAAEEMTLEASFGLIPAFRRGRDRPELRVRVESGAGTRTFHTFKVGGGGSINGWSPMSISLEEHAGRRVRVRFEVDSVQGRPQYVALSTPRVVRHQHAPSTVLLITSDAHRADYLGGGNAKQGFDTPNLDALSARGLTFTDCLAVTNLPRPSHVALMTGRSPLDTRILDEEEPLPAEIETLAEVFHRNGWITVAAVGGATLGPPASGLGRGFDLMLAPEEGLQPARVTITWLRFQLRQLEREPVFVWLHLSDPLLPYSPDAKFVERLLGGKLDLEDPRLPRPVAPIAPIPASREARDFLEGLYRAEICGLDDALTALLRQDRVRRGWVAYTSGHGESLGEHGFWWTHAGLYPQTLRVPLLIAGPGAQPGRRVPAPVTQLDLGRTLLELVGLADEDFPGRSLTDYLGPEGRAAEPRFALGAHGEHASVTSGRWHLQLTLDPLEEPNRERPGTPHALELYDLENDPSCENDRVNYERERATELRAALLEWLGAGWIDPECRCDWCSDFR